MKPVLFCDHAFLDGYGSPIAIAEDVTEVSRGLNMEDTTL